MHHICGRIISSRSNKPISLHFMGTSNQLRETIFPFSFFGKQKFGRQWKWFARQGQTLPGRGRARGRKWNFRYKMIAWWLYLHFDPFVMWTVHIQTKHIKMTSFTSRGMGKGTQELEWFVLFLLRVGSESPEYWTWAMSPIRKKMKKKKKLKREVPRCVTLFDDL